jgi:UDP-N-acetylmuramoylalanine--D-glutamate ligase
MSALIHLIVGLRRTGLSIAAYLTRKNLPFFVLDIDPDPKDVENFKNAYPEAEIFLGELPSAIYPKLLEIITSPGIAWESPIFQKALELGIPVFGDIECFAREVEHPVVAITGTNGKSTVTTLVGEMAKASGFSTAVGGNIGLPVLNLLEDKNLYNLWVLELSSFQLASTQTLAPLASTILNISEDHMDRHQTMSSYIESKHRIYKNTSMAIYNREDSNTFPSSTVGKQVSFGLNEPAEGDWGIRIKEGKTYIAQGQDCILSTDSLQIKGKHNWQNAMAACALASAAGIDRKAMVAVLSTFSGLEHRCQWVKTLDGVDWINDSKGTNVGATVSAIAGIGDSMQGKIVLIAGGLCKGADFRELRASVAEYVRTLVLIGQDAAIIEEALSDLVPIEHAISLEEAVAKAKSQAKAGDVVLLSPACASMDMFKDFNHRGESFVQLVQGL